MVRAIPFFIHKRRINILKEYLKAQNKTNETILRNTYSLDELGRFSKSDYRWADNRIKSFQHRIVKKGEIYQFEFVRNLNSLNAIIDNYVDFCYLTCYNP